MDFNLLNYNVLDVEFYKKNYNHFNSKYTKNDIFLHWLKHGEKEGCVLNQQQLNNRYELNISHTNELLELLEYKENNEIEFNILIRTSERPEYFKECLESIKDQKFTGKVNIYVCYDTVNTLNYLKKYEGINLIFYEKIYKSYNFNLYCNKLLDQVKEGWIIFMDDDDKFINNNCLQIISAEIKDDKDLIIWNFLRPDKIIAPKEKFIIGEIDTTCFCFNSKYKKKSKWIDKKCSDLFFFKELDNKVKFNKKFIRVALVRTIYSDFVAGYSC